MNSTFPFFSKGGGAENFLRKNDFLLFKGVNRGGEGVKLYLPMYNSTERRRM